MVNAHPLDDPSIIDSDDLYRRLKPNQYDPEENKPTPEAFLPRPQDNGKLSVFVARLTTIRFVIDQISRFPNFKDWKIGILQARVPRKEGLFVRMAPSPNNPSHAQIGGELLMDETKGINIRRRLAQACNIVEWHDDYFKDSNPC